MTFAVRTSRLADEDIAEAVRFYADSGGTPLAADFIDALEHASRLLVDHPEIGSSRFENATGIPGLRGLALARFPYVMVYAADRSNVHVLRVLHSNRDIPAELARQS